jgi:hypothetical protein
MLRRSLLFVLLVLLPWGAAGAHSWYDSRCCNDRDCRRATNVETLPNGARRVTADNGMVVMVNPGFARIHPSQDNDYHICYYLTWRGEPMPRCLYVPGSS